MAQPVIDAVQIPDGSARLDGDLRIPDVHLRQGSGGQARRGQAATGLVIFAHGSGSSRFSTRNRQVAEALDRAGFATLLLDLLTKDEESIDVYSREFRFDIPRLGRRMIAATDWARNDPRVRMLPIGYFGASTGAAAALIAAAERPDDCCAVVSRGGRPDLAGIALADVKAPTLMIVGGDDGPVIDLNREAMQQMRAPVKLEIVPGASHLFEEPGTLERVEHLAIEWFTQALTGGCGADLQGPRRDDVRP